LQDIGEETEENLVSTATEDDPAQEFLDKPGVPVGSALGSPRQPVSAQGSEFVSNLVPAQELCGRRSIGDHALQSASATEDTGPSQL
jgi:hypothetical protein